MAAANGRERRPEPGGNHGGWDGAAEVVCQGRGRGDVKDQKGETPLARGDLSPGTRPGPVHSSFPAIAPTWAPRGIGRDGSFRGGPPVSRPRTGSPQEYRTRLAYLFLLFGDDDWRRRRLGFRSQFRLPTRPRQHTLVPPLFWRIGGGAASTSTAAVTSKEVKVGPACHWVGVPVYGVGCIYLLR